MVCGVYLIAHKSSGKVYVGQSCDVYKRWKHHIAGYCKSSMIDRFIGKYGVDDFDFRILIECNAVDLDFWERYYIAFFNSFEDGFNLTLGGQDWCDGVNPMSNPEVKFRKSVSHSRSCSSTGFYRVHKHVDKKVKCGFIFSYAYTINGCKRFISDRNIRDLEVKVKCEGLDWFVVNSKLADETIVESDRLLDLFPKLVNSTGFYRVRKMCGKAYKQGFVWRYSFYDGDGKSRSLSSVDLCKLRSRVLDCGLDWFVLNRGCALVSLGFGVF